MRGYHLYILTGLLVCGCRSSAPRVSDVQRPASVHAAEESGISAVAVAPSAETPQSDDRVRNPGSGTQSVMSAVHPVETAPIAQAAFRGPANAHTASPSDELSDVSAAGQSPDTAPGTEFSAWDGESSGHVTLTDVVDSVHRTFPLVAAARLERPLRSGEQIAAWGEFDTKIKGASENQPLGFYETYRNSLGLYRPIYSGGEWFVGYRNGGGDFEPWYKERETNDGGEFKAGIRVPLIRDRDIDGRRAALWRATYHTQIADPVIRTALIGFSYEASLAYWKWVAAGRKYRLGREWVELARARNAGIARNVELGNLDPPELTDNQRAIAKREAKLADSLSVLQQAAVKLSLYFRDAAGQPVLLSEADLPDFPPLRELSDDQLSADIQQARLARPDLQALDLERRKLEVSLAEAVNLTRPGLDAQLIGGQDVGRPTSSKRDKSEFELEASLYLDIPVERRKGLGKAQAVRQKIAQLNAKQQLLRNKIDAEIRAAAAAIRQSRIEATRAEEAFRLAQEIADIERRKFNLGDEKSDLLKVVLREQYALEAAEEAISARYNHFIALADYAAALSVERPAADLLPAVE